MVGRKEWKEGKNGRKERMERRKEWKEGWKEGKERMAGRKEGKMERQKEGRIDKQ